MYNNNIINYTEPDEAVVCQGLWDRCYTPLYSDETAGATTAKNLWKSYRENAPLMPVGGAKLSCHCSCCDSYSKWKKSHSVEASQLQKVADAPFYYAVTDEHIEVKSSGAITVYNKTIRALTGAPQGPCTGIAYAGGKHPYTCKSCYSLSTGKSSQLNRKLHRVSSLKHPREVASRATKSGVVHKYCSKQAVEYALQSHRYWSKCNEQKIVRLSQANEKLLLQVWNTDPTVKSFIKMLLSLLENHQLSSFDFSFLQNWLGKKFHGRYYHADEQARNLAILLSNRLGEKMYSTVAPMIGLPLARQAQRIRAKDQFSHTYMPGLNDWALEVAASREVRPLQMSMDGTRIVRVIELYLDTYLLGKAFPPDVRLYPNETNHVKADTWEQVQQHVLSVRANKQYSAEAYSFNLVDTSGKLTDIMVGSIPEAQSGVTASHILALMLEIESRARKYNIPLIGHCTDSASNALNALIKLASPNTYNGENMCFLGLRRPGFVFFGPFLKDTYPSIAIPCWDHSSRTSLRNLMNTKLTLTAGYITADCGIKNAVVATIQDLHLLKKNNPSCPVKYGDITPFLRQNCDATARVLTQAVVDALASSVVGSQATQLYLQASIWIHAPFRNEKFGPPASIAQSLWAGIMTWRRWRQYIIVSPDLSLTHNFISRSHYLTLELLAHAGINFLLCLYYSFPNLLIAEYSLRHTGNRNLEAIHGTFRGGTSSLPITSPNLSFTEFLMRMNKAQQIQSAEHVLKKTEGNSIVASKKKRRTFASSSNEPPSSAATHVIELPGTYDLMMKELNDACHRGDTDSKLLIEQLTPTMAEALKAADQWDSPTITGYGSTLYIGIAMVFCILPIH